MLSIDIEILFMKVMQKNMKIFSINEVDAHESKT